jgi:hypothetical protein
MTALRARVRRELAPFVGPAAVLVLYAIARVAHAAIAGGRGILAPSGDVDGALVVLGFATFVLRMLAIIVVPMVVVYRLVMRALERWTRDRPRSP